MSTEHFVGMPDGGLMYLPVEAPVRDPSHITSEFALALEEEAVPVFLDDVDLFGSDADSLYDIEDEIVDPGDDE